MPDEKELSMAQEDSSEAEHLKVWRITKENVQRWREQSTDPNFEPTMGYLKSVVFVLTEHLLERRRWRKYPLGALDRKAGE